MDEIRLSDGRIDIRDETVDGPFTAAVEGLDLTVSGFTNEKDKRSRLALSLRTDAGEEVGLEGFFSVNPLSAEGKLSVKQVPLKRYAPYYQDRVLFHIEDGELSVQANVDFTQEDEQGKQRIRLSDVTTGLTDLRLKREGEVGDFFKAAAISLSETSLDMSEKELVIGNFTTEKGGIWVSRSSEGVVNLKALFPPPSGDAPGEDRRAPPEAAPAAGSEWTVSLKRGEVAGYAVAFEDQMTAPPIGLLADEIHLSLKDISTARDSRGSMSLGLRIPKQGELEAAGDIGINPVLADLKVDVKNLDIRPFEPYWRDRTNITLTGGALSALGKTQFSAATDAGVKGSYRGNMAISDFATVDNARAEDFLKWKSLQANGMDVAVNPTRISIDEVALTDFYSRISIDETGRANLQDIVVTEAPAGGAEANRKTAKDPREEAPIEKTAGPDIDVRTVTLREGERSIIRINSSGRAWTRI